MHQGDAGDALHIVAAGGQDRPAVSGGRRGDHRHAAAGRFLRRAGAARRRTLHSATSDGAEPSQTLVLPRAAFTELLDTVPRLRDACWPGWRRTCPAVSRPPPRLADQALTERQRPSSAYGPTAPERVSPQPSGAPRFSGQRCGASPQDRQLRQDRGVTVFDRDRLGSVERLLQLWRGRAGIDERLDQPHPGIGGRPPDAHPFGRFDRDSPACWISLTPGALQLAIHEEQGPRANHESGADPAWAAAASSPRHVTASRSASAAATAAASRSPLRLACTARSLATSSASVSSSTICIGFGRIDQCTDAVEDRLGSVRGGPGPGATSPRPA